MTPVQTQKSPVVAALLDGLVDYAGLFPPAGLSMADAARNYAAYRDGEDRAMLGKFVVPAARLDELAGERAKLEDASPWPLTVLIGGDVSADVQKIETWRKTRREFVVESAELKAAEPVDIIKAATAIPAEIDAYFEIPLKGSTADFLDVLAEQKRFAKIRTGGEQEKLIPPAKEIADFLVQCSQAKVPFKATAGLHHPLRAEKRLTYADNSPHAVMHGFLNVFLAAALAWKGVDARALEDLLNATSAPEFSIGSDAIQWRNFSVTENEMSSARKVFAHSFGSCSFEEPTQEFAELTFA